MPRRTYSFVKIAESGERFADFGPYVAAVAESGAVAFRAATGDERSGVFVGDGVRIDEAVDVARFGLRDVCSHPAFDDDGSLCFFAERAAGGRGLYRARGDELEIVAESGGFLAEIGPLGPTARRGAVAFRGSLASGASAILCSRAGVSTLVADSSREIESFDGLPFVLRDRSVVFRATLRGGASALLRRTGDRLPTLANTLERFRELGRFPAAGADGSVLFCAQPTAGEPGVFLWRDGRIERALDAGSVFESYRGALADGSGRIVFYATPRGGSLGIYSGPDPVADRVLALGQPLLGSTLSAFALNPVSINARGQLALRVELADGRHAILRADPS